jgi:hypothetical protein
MWTILDRLSTSSIASTTLLSRSRQCRPRSIQHTLHLVRYNPERGRANGER